MDCWKCKRKINELGKLSFKAHCAYCFAWLHCCVNCRFYKVGLPNHCQIPGTEMISDREGGNYCEEFSAKEEAGPPKTSTSLEDAARKLFGDVSEDDSNPKNFNDLFKS